MVIDKHTLIMGLIGNPLGHSLSPIMHNLTLNEMNLNGVYLPIEVKPQNLREAVMGLRALNFTGVNVTIPYKQAVIPFLDELSPEASACQAVNLIKNVDGRLVGYNTDGMGFMASLREEGVANLSRVSVIGAGGAAQSVTYELVMAGAKQLDIFDINEGRAMNLAGFVNGLGLGRAGAYVMTEGGFERFGAEANLIINCSPVGMYPYTDQTPLQSFQNIKPDTVVYDLIYNPPKTKFLTLAEESNLKTINGAAMLVHQGALTLKILSGFEPPLCYMKEVIKNSLQK